MRAANKDSVKPWPVQKHVNYKQNCFKYHLLLNQNLKNNNKLPNLFDIWRLKKKYFYTSEMAN